MRQPVSLVRRVSLLVSLGFLLIWALSTLTMALVLRSEQEEQLDLTLRETAELYRPLLARRAGPGDGEAALPRVPAEDPEEDIAFVLFDADGTVLLRSDSSGRAALPAPPLAPGYRETGTHVFYLTEPDAAGRIAAFGDPLIERREAYRESLVAFMLPMLLMLPLVYLLVTWISRAALRPLDALRSGISSRDEGRLDPLETASLPEELRAIASTVNGLMGRLGQALDAERAFATNAAHELRTPVAVALAQVQRLRAQQPELEERIDRIESALVRMSGLVKRLLQLARAEAGLGTSAEVNDLSQLLGLMLEDLRRDPVKAGRLRATLPGSPVRARIDADAFAILAGNLIDNAFQHSPSGSEIVVELSETGRLSVVNDGAPLPPGDLETLVRRFRTGSASRNGFGLGLHIADTIARQTGGALELVSPPEGLSGGLEAVYSPSPRAMV